MKLVRNIALYVLKYLKGKTKKLHLINTLSSYANVTRTMNESNFFGTRGKRGTIL